MPSSRTKVAHIIQVKHRNKVETPLTDWLHKAYHLQDAPAAKPVAAVKAARKPAAKRVAKRAARRASKPVAKRAEAGREARPDSPLSPLRPGLRPRGGG